jgi:hypothetical protein
MDRPPNLADLIELWLAENASSFYVMRRDPDYDFGNYIAQVYRKSFGSHVTIYEDRIVINDDNRDPDGLTIMAADPKLFELLSNRLYILEQGFIKATNSRIETAKRDKDEGTHW